MNMTIELTERLQRAAKEYDDDRFFCVRSADREFFICNWVFGIRFTQNEIAHPEGIEELEKETERICAASSKYKDIVRHIYTRSWTDILIGAGVHQEANLVKMLPDEYFIFRERNWGVLPFETKGGHKFYVREIYFDLADEIIGEGMHPVIFRPLSGPAYPKDYRPMLLKDGNGEIRGMINTISEENVRNPINRTKEYQTYVEEVMPTIY